MTSFSEISEKRKQMRDDQLSREFEQEKKRIKTIDDFLQDCHSHFKIEKNWPISIVRKGDVISLDMSERKIIVKFLGEDFVSVTTRLPSGRTEMEEIPMGPANAKAVILDFLDV